MPGRLSVSAGLIITDSRSRADLDRWNGFGQITPGPANHITPDISYLAGERAWDTEAVPGMVFSHRIGPNAGVCICVWTERSRTGSLRHRTCQWHHFLILDTRRT